LRAMRLAEVVEDEGGIEGEEEEEKGQGDRGGTVRLVGRSG
jgi:hypothetical protein